MDAEEYAEYCRAAGWELVDGRRRFCIFRKISESALPIVTEEERFSNICRAEWRWCLLSLLTTGVVYGISAVRFTGSYFVIMFFSNAILFTLLALALLPVYEVLQCISMAVWQVKAWRKNQKGRTSCLWKAAGNVCFGCYHNINAGGADFRVGLGRNGRLGGRFMDLDRDYHGCSGWTLVLPTFPERKLGASDRGRNWEDNSLYVRYENAILTLYTTKPPEGEQIDIIREKLEL